MKAKSDDMVDALEQAILTRAKSLADELATKARHRRDIILREANDRLSLADERENASARAEAERAQRRQVQASELKLQARLDRLRWELVHAVQGRLAERMAELRADRDAYLGWLESMVREADRLLPDGDIHAEVNAEDHAWLAEHWQALVDRAAPWMAAPNWTIALRGVCRAWRRVSSGSFLSACSRANHRAESTDGRAATTSRPYRADQRPDSAGAPARRVKWRAGSDRQDGHHR